MSPQKTVQLKHSELNILKELAKLKHPQLANKLKHYMNAPATKGQLHVVTESTHEYTDDDGNKRSLTSLKASLIE